MYKAKNHSRCSLKAHLVFVVKYRKNLINKDIDFLLKTSNHKDDRHSCAKLKTYHFSGEKHINQKNKEES